MQIQFLGQSHPVMLEYSPLLRRGGFAEMRNDILYLQIPANLKPKMKNAAITSTLENFYRTQAIRIIRSRADFFAAQMQIKYLSITLNDPKSRWGSCDPHGNLRFSWRVIMVPPDLLDYLVVHELCHILHFNHSKAYWATVAQILPDYKTRRKQLNQLAISVQAAEYTLKKQI
jgi:predicted metal-dependent hydrolase